MGRPVITTKPSSETGRRVNVLLTSARVSQGFRDAFFAAAGRENMTPSDFAIAAVAEKIGTEISTDQEKRL